MEGSSLTFMLITWCVILGTAAISMTKILRYKKEVNK